MCCLFCEGITIKKKHKQITRIKFVSEFSRYFVMRMNNTHNERILVMLLYIILPWKDEIEYIHFVFNTCVSWKIENVLSCKIIEHEQSFLCLPLFWLFTGRTKTTIALNTIVYSCTCKKLRVSRSFLVKKIICLRKSCCKNGYYKLNCTR